MQPQSRKFLLVSLPVAVVLSMSALFSLPRYGLMDKDTGYLLGFAVYWVFWCLVVPTCFLGLGRMKMVITGGVPLFSHRNRLAAVLWALVLVVTLFMYGRSFLEARPALILLAVPLAVVNGVCEEVLWRGLYVQEFPDSPWMGIFYPSLGFAIWHFAPQLIYPAGSVIGFMFSTFFLGLAFGYVAYRTRAAKWTAVLHSLSGILALSGMLAPSLLGILNR